MNCWPTSFHESFFLFFPVRLFSFFLSICLLKLGTGRCSGDKLRLLGCGVCCATLKVKGPVPRGTGSPGPGAGLRGV